jgi:AcrR family transcriptional regulator
MRVTAQTKAATRQRILDAARQLFAAGGFETATTRALADAAGIASGTLFNYFATKEAVLAALAMEAAADAQSAFEETDHDSETFEEELFAYVAIGLRKLKPLRKHLSALLETAMSPLAKAGGDEELSLCTLHLETVARLAKKHGLSELPAVALQLYWTLYTGVLMFWASDKSPKQEDTLALLDHSLAMFIGWLEREGEPAGNKKKGEIESCPRR